MPTPAVVEREMTVDERKRKLKSINELLQTSGYVYDLAKSAVDFRQMPPPSGTRINCEAAARLFCQLALDMGVELKYLQGLHYSSKQGSGGYFVPDNNGTYRALGNPAIISGTEFSGWEFSHHWRVQDPVTKIIYDPTFGTSSETGGNPIGIKCTEESTEVGKRSTTMKSVYGDKYSITNTIPGPTTLEIMAQRVVSVHDQIQDVDFLAKPEDVTNLKIPQ